MPATLSAALQSHLDGELKTLTTLWRITRVDGARFFFTDHDVAITYEGQVYKTGVGYDRSAVEDKRDFSVDNTEVRGILNFEDVSRSDVRAGLFDSAEVEILIVNYEDLSQGAITRRRGWLGDVKQNNKGEFTAELRGLTQALAEGMATTYVPNCRVDLGSPECRVPLDTLTEREGDTLYQPGEWMHVSDYPDYVWRCTGAGTTEGSGFDPSIYDVSEDGAEVTDGTATFTSHARFDKTFEVVAVQDRRTFTISVSEPRSTQNDRWFSNGVLTFDYGDNAEVSYQIKTGEADSAGAEVEITLYLRAGFNVQVGDTGTIYPGCAKTVIDCAQKFNNILNYRGFPYIPGENYQRTYPDAKN